MKFFSLNAFSRYDVRASTPPAGDRKARIRRTQLRELLTSIEIELISVDVIGSLAAERKLLLQLKQSISTYVSVRLLKVNQESV